MTARISVPKSQLVILGGSRRGARRGAYDGPNHLDASGLSVGFLCLLIASGCGDDQRAPGGASALAEGGYGGADEPAEPVDPETPEEFDFFWVSDENCEFRRFDPERECLQQPPDAPLVSTSYVCVTLDDLIDPCSDIHLKTASAEGGAPGTDVPTQCPDVTDVVFGHSQCAPNSTPICLAPVVERDDGCCYLVRTSALAC